MDTLRKQSNRVALPRRSPQPAVVAKESQAVCTVIEGQRLSLSAGFFHTILNVTRRNRATGAHESAAKETFVVASIREHV